MVIVVFCRSGRAAREALAVGSGAWQSSGIRRQGGEAGGQHGCSTGTPPPTTPRRSATGAPRQRTHRLQRHLARQQAERELRLGRRAGARWACEGRRAGGQGGRPALAGGLLAHAALALKPGRQLPGQPGSELTC